MATVCFLQVEGSLVYTDNAGSGFKVFGRGTDFEPIIGGKYETQLKKEAEEYEKILAAWAAEMPEGLQDDLDKREAAKFFPNDPPALQHASIRASLLAAGLEWGLFYILFWANVTQKIVAWETYPKLVFKGLVFIGALSPVMRVSSLPRRHEP